MELRTLKEIVYVWLRVVLCTRAFALDITLEVYHHGQNILTGLLSHSLTLHVDAQLEGGKGGSGESDRD